MKQFNLQTPRNRLPKFTGRAKAAIRVALFFCLVFVSKMGIAQTFPPASSCTSNDLQLVDARLETRDCAIGSNTLQLGIYNKTGSTRTAFALWGTLKITSPSGDVTFQDITACSKTSVPADGTYYIDSDYNLAVLEGYSYTLTNLFLAWTTPNKKENCEFLRANTATVSPKCGPNNDININVGISAALAEQTGSCSGSNKYAAVRITTSGGIAPYVISVAGISGTQSLAEGGSYTYSSLTLATEYTFTIKDKNGAGCTITRKITPVGPANVTFNAGFQSDFTKNCLNNTNGKTIGETAETNFTYSWSPATGLSATNIGNPTANPSSTTTYEVTKTYTPTGCKATASVVVTVDRPNIVAEAGNIFTKTCTSLTTGQAIGETPDNTNYTYAWTSNNNTDVNGGLSATNVADPTANPTATTTYTVRKTEKFSGCYDDDQVVVTVSTGVPSLTACLVQPTLCASSGSITFTATGNYEYSINGGSNYQDGATFTDLASGAVTGLKVRNKDNGCTSTLDCSAVPVCTGPSTSTPEQNLTQSFEEKTASAASQSLARTVTNNGIAVKAYPNPFSSKVSFNVTSPIAGYGSLELYNMQGQKLTTVFQGRIPEGNSNYQYYIPGNSNVTLMYILRVGEKSVTGKLMNVKK